MYVHICVCVRARILAYMVQRVCVCVVPYANALWAANRIICVAAGPGRPLTCNVWMGARVASFTAASARRFRGNCFALHMGAYFGGVGIFYGVWSKFIIAVFVYDRCV